MAFRLLAMFLMALPLSGCSPQRLFYYPNRTLYADPDHTGLAHEIVAYPSLNGKKLVGLFFPAAGAAKGSVVHFHGNYGNISNHFPLALFLVKGGFNVLSFDYQGYGASEGKPTPARLIEDGRASVRYAASRSGPANLPVFVFGQSLGGAVAVVTAAKEPRVRAAVIEASFSTHRRMAATALRRSLWTWGFSPLAPIVLSGRHDPLNAIRDIAPRPVLLIHGDRDSIVPVRMSKDLFAAAREPKRLWIVPGAGHLECRKAAAGEYERTILGFPAEATK